MSSVFFSRKNRVTPSAAAPGDTNPSDATGQQTRSLGYKSTRNAFVADTRSRERVLWLQMSTYLLLSEI